MTIAYRTLSALVGAALLLAIPSAAGAQSALQQLAASMQVGAWATLTTANISSVLGDSVSGGVAHILPYADKLHWDPITRKVYYAGSDDPGNGRRFVAYDVATNAWVTLSDPWGGSNVAHQYGLVDIDVVNRRIYSIMPDGNNGHYYDLTTGAWNGLSSFPASPYSCCGGAAYFPERQALAYAWGRSLWQRNNSGSWTEISSSINTSYHAIAYYNPVHKVVVFGGGNDTNRSFYRINVAGQVTSLGQPPINLENPRVEFVADPVTGDFLVFGMGQRFYTYNPLTDTWTSRSTSGIPAAIWSGSSSNLLSTLATAIPEYGVIFFTSCQSGGACAVTLYKNGLGTGDAISPSTPPGLSVR